MEHRPKSELPADFDPLAKFLTSDADPCGRSHLLSALVACSARELRRQVDHVFEIEGLIIGAITPSNVKLKNIEPQILHALEIRRIPIHLRVTGNTQKTHLVVHHLGAPMGLGSSLGRSKHQDDPKEQNLEASRIDESLEKAGLYDESDFSV